MQNPRTCAVCSCYSRKLLPGTSRASAPAPSAPATTVEGEQPAVTAEVQARVDVARVQYLEIAAFRIAGLLQLRNVRSAHEELSRLGSLQDLASWEGDAWGTAVALRIIEAEVKSAVGQRRQAVDLLYLLLSSVRTLLATPCDGKSGAGPLRDEGAQARGGGGTQDGNDGDTSSGGATTDSVKDKEKEKLGEDAGLTLLQTPGASSTALLVQQERAVICALVSQHIESGDYASARALLEPRRDERGAVAAGGDGWDAAFGWALVRLHVHFGSLPAAEKALSTCKQRDPEAAKGPCLFLPRSFLPSLSSLSSPPPAAIQQRWSNAAPEEEAAGETGADTQAGCAEEEGVEGGKREGTTDGRREPIASDVSA